MITINKKAWKQFRAINAAAAAVDEDIMYSRRIVATIAKVLGYSELVETMEGITLRNYTMLRTGKLEVSQ